MSEQVPLPKIVELQPGMKIEPLPSDVLVVDMYFGDYQSQGGIILMSDDGVDRGIKPRWAKVWAVGEKVQDLKPGMWILIEHGRWSRGIEIEDENASEPYTIRKVDTKAIMMTSENQPSEGRLNGSN